MRASIAWMLCLAAAACGGVERKLHPLEAAIEDAGYRLDSFAFNGHVPARSRIPFNSVPYESERLRYLRKHYPIEKAVSGAKSEWEAQLALKEWVHRAIPGGNPEVAAGTAREVLEQVAQGRKFYCTHYALTYVECALALGWQARRIGVDRKHGDTYPGSTHHGVAEVWSNSYAKWVVIDPQSNLHYEKAGVPLNAWEIRAEWLRNGGRDVRHMVGVPPVARHMNPACVWWDRSDEDETAGYFWLYIVDQAVNTGAGKRYMFPQDRHNKGLTWYQNDNRNKRSRLHTGYAQNRFLPTPFLEDFYWTVGVVEITVRGRSKGGVSIELDTYHPDLRGYQRWENGEWRLVSDPTGVYWGLKYGTNEFRVRTLGPRGTPGPETRLKVFVMN